MANLNIAIKIAAQDAASGPIGKIAGSLKSLGSTAVTSGLTAVAGGLAAITAAGVGVAAGIAASVNTAADLENQLSGVEAVTGASADELAGLKELTMGLGVDPNLKVSALEAASAIEMLGRNGLPIPDIMDGAARSTVLLSNATGADFAMAADIATDTMALFNIAAADMTDAVDGITSVTTNSKFSIDDYKLALAQGGGVAAAAGVEFDDFNASIAGISPLFASGSEAGTSFKTFLQRLVPSSSAASDAMYELGIITEDGKNQFFDATGNLKSMSEVSGILQSALGSLTEEQRTAALSTIFGTDAMRAAVGMAELGSDGFDKLSESMGKTSAADAAAARVDNMRGALEILWSVVEGVKIEIGDKFLPIVTDAIRQVANIIAENKDVIVNVFGQIAGGVQSAIDTIYPYITRLIDALGNGELAGAINGLMSLITGDWDFPWEDVFPEWLAETIYTVTAAIDEIYPVVVQFASGVWAQLLPGLQLLGDLGLQLANAVLPLLSSAWDYLMENLDTILPIVGAVGLAILALSSPITTVIALVVTLATAWANNWGGIQEKTTAVMEALQPWWDRLSELFGNFINALLPRLQEVWQTLVNVWQTELQPALSDLWAAFGDLFEALGLGAGDVDWLSVVTGSLKLALGGVLLMVELLNPIIQWYSTVIGFAVDKVTLMVNAVASLKRALDAVTAPLQRVASNISDMINQALQMPDWLIPGSPTPFEVGLRGIGRAINSLPDLDLPITGGGIGSMAAQGALPQAAPVMGGATWNITIQANDETGGRKAATGFIEELRARGLR